MKRLTACFFLLIMLASAFFAAEGESTEGDEGSIRLSDKVLLSFYDNSIFFGDSIMQQFRRYRSEVRQKDPDFLEEVSLMATSSISLYNASRRNYNDSGSFLYRGSKKTMYSITKELKPDKIFILLGLNDEVGIKIDKGITWVEYIIENMPAYAPDTEIYFFSQTPVTPLYCRKRKYPNYAKQIDEYNQRLRETCEQTGAHYVEIAEYLKNDEGYLEASYSSDGECHLNEKGLALWVQALCDYAQTQYDLGLWIPADIEKGE